MNYIKKVIILLLFVSSVSSAQTSFDYDIIKAHDIDLFEKGNFEGVYTKDYKSILTIDLENKILYLKTHTTPERSYDIKDFKHNEEQNIMDAFIISYKDNESDEIFQIYIVEKGLKAFIFKKYSVIELKKIL